MDLECIMKVQLTGLADALNVVCEGEEMIKDHFCCLED